MNWEELEKKICKKERPVTVINRGVTPLSLLGIAFIVMKIMGYITWSWWWVLAPFWIPVLIAVSLMFFIILIFALIAYKESKRIIKVKVSEETPKKKRTKKTKKDDGETKGKDE